ncbi:MAG: glycosyltransferase [Gammaproteobacteria bacterium]
MLVACDYFLPSQRAGGPAKSVRSILDALGATSRFLIVTRDRDRGDAGAYPGVAAARWCRAFGALVYYAPPGVVRWCTLAALARRVAPDVIYLNSLFSPQFSSWLLVMARLHWLPGQPRIVVAPRGELAPSALAIKPARKQLFLAFARLCGLYRGVAWHATGVGEAADIRTALAASLGLDPRSTRVLIAPPPLLAQRQPNRAPTKQVGRLRLVFMSRISRVKNLHVALAAVRLLRGEVEFDIYGAIARPEDATYWRECQALLNDLPPGIRVNYRGSVPRDEVLAVLAGYHAFVLPSAGENYGHAIVEALLAGCIPCISDRTPWRGLAAVGVGWDVDVDSAEPLAVALQSCIELDASSFADHGAAIRRYLDQQFDAAAVRSANAALFAEPSLPDTGRPESSGEMRPEA